jgi:hypothetical protein
LAADPLFYRFCRVCDAQQSVYYGRVTRHVCRREVRMAPHHCGRLPAAHLLLLSALGGLRPASFGPARPNASVPAEVAGYYACSGHVQSPPRPWSGCRASILVCLSVSRISSAPLWARARGATICGSACISVPWMKKRRNRFCDQSS